MLTGGGSFFNDPAKYANPMLTGGEENDQEEDDNIEEDEGGGGGYILRGNERFQKRLKPNKPVSGYDFAGPSDANWRDHESFVLLEVWGDRFLQLGRRILRNEDWNEVAEEVSEELRSERSETQCCRMIDSLKRKYKKEKIKMEKSGSGSSKWSFFNKMDMLFGSSPKSYPGDSEEDDNEEEEEREIEYERRKKANDVALYKLLADSVERFGKIYEKMEKSKKE
ncbi:unnamed protein product [Eruca vesicaria subsp. sativa]|uniref:Myb/SANT-like DNA-binding domain-containing protein n=1 Tax=Eruca vesicaria subsp. sativa TaxID=29727 RepID=A0ABC8LHM0_ERUVS|nr:unnamed protein product [Eruca vesicaria subsp. sativa]